MLPEYPESTRRAFARNVLRNSLLLRRGENLLVETWSGTQAWAESLVLEARMLGARPLLVVEDEATYWKGVEEAPASHLGQVGSHEWATLKACDANVYLWGPYDTAREEALPSSVRLLPRAFQVSPSSPVVRSSRAWLRMTRSSTAGRATISSTVPASDGALRMSSRLSSSRVMSTAFSTSVFCSPSPT